MIKPIDLELDKVMMPNWFSSPEHKMLLHCLGINNGVDTFNQLCQEAERIINWSLLLELAIQHGVFPSCYKRIAELCPEAVPAEILNSFTLLYQTQAQRNLRKSAELLRVLEFLASHDISSIPFKGPTLALIAYGDVTLRQYVDLDILVSRQDMGNVKELLVNSGYRLEYPFTKKQEQFHLSQTCEFTFVHPRLTMLDVHWRFAPNYMGSNLDPETAFARRVTIDLEGKIIYSLAPDDILLLLCYHGYFHLWPTLGMVNDVARLLKSQEPWDWPDLLQRARDLGMHRLLLLGLSLANEVLSASVPEEVVQEASRDLAVSTLKRQVLSKLFSSNNYEPGFWAVVRFHWRAKEHLKERLRYFFIRLAIPTLEDWQFVRLPDRYFNLYYLLRPLRLMIQGVILPIQKWFRAQRQAYCSTN